MIKITFPDNSVREYAKGTTAMQIAESISSRLASLVHTEVYKKSNLIEIAFYYGTIKSYFFGIIFLERSFINKFSNVEIVLITSAKISSSISCLCLVSKLKKLIIFFRLLLSELFL